MDFRQVEGAEARLGYAFRDRSHLAQALTHSSGKSETAPSNERLEFLGDSVLGTIVARYLYLTHPSCDEGELTRIRSAVVSAASLADVSRALGLGEFFLVGKSMANQERYPTSLLANVFEAVVAAIYLDGGFEAAERFVLDQLRPRLQAVASKETAKNWKSILQQYAQRTGITPTYRVTRVLGPEHGKHFEVVTRLGDRGEHGRGEGSSKKEAEQRAAEATLRSLLGARIDEAQEQDIGLANEWQAAVSALHPAPHGAFRAAAGPTDGSPAPTGLHAASRAGGATREALVKLVKGRKRK